MKKTMIALIGFFAIFVFTACGSNLDLNSCSGNIIGNLGKYHNVYLTMRDGRMEIGDYYYEDSAMSDTGVTADYSLSNKYYFDYKVEGSDLTITDDTGESRTYHFELGKCDDGREMIVFDEAFLGFGTDWAMTNDDSDGAINENPPFFNEDNIHYSFDGLISGTDNSVGSGDISGNYTPYNNTVTYPGGVLDGSPPDYSRCALRINGEDVYLDWYDTTYHGILDQNNSYRYGIDWTLNPLLVKDAIYEKTTLEVDADGDLEMTIDYNYNGTIINNHLFFY